MQTQYCLEMLKSQLDLAKLVPTWVAYNSLVTDNLQVTTKSLYQLSITVPLIGRNFTLHPRLPKISILFAIHEKKP